MTAVPALGVVRLVPSQPSVREQMADVVALGIASGAGDELALERLLVLADLLAHRIDQDRATSAPSDREAVADVTRAGVATIEERTAA